MRARHCRCPWSPLVLLAVLVGPAVGAAPGGRPVVAVFSVEDRTGKQSAALLQQLTDYLSAKVAEGGFFQIVPRAQIKARLTEQKKESYQQCYDEKCQIEIGRELAAQKSLSTQIIQIGSKCAITATLYDLKRAASEGSASEKTGCGEDDLVAAVEKVAALLKPRLHESVRPAATTGRLLLREVPAGAQVFIDGVLRGLGPILEPLTAAPGSHRVRIELVGHEPWEQRLEVALDRTAVASIKLLKRVSVEINSEPSGVAVSLDDQPRGKTPLQLSLLPRRTYQLRLVKAGYHPLSQSVELSSDEPRELSYTLEASPERFATRTEWFALQSNLAFGMGDKMGLVAGGGAIDVITLKWKYVNLTIFEGGGGAGSKGGEDGASRFYIFMQSRVAFPFRFGRRGQHQLRAGLGFGVLAIARDQETWIQTDARNWPPFVGLAVCPSVEYTYQTRGSFVWGGGFAAHVPVTRDFTVGTSEPSLGRLYLRMGWSSDL